jgi:hypothetical protein
MLMTAPWQWLGGAADHLAYGWLQKEASLAFFKDFAGVFCKKRKRCYTKPMINAVGACRQKVIESAGECKVFTPTKGTRATSL